MGIRKILDIQREILQFLEQNHGPQNVRNVIDHVAQRLNVSQDERKTLTQIGRRPVFDTRLMWAISELRHAKLLENTGHGIFQITDRGLAEIRSEPNPKSNFLDKYSEFLDWKKNTAAVEDIAKKKIKGKPPGERYGLVALIDVLGIKGIWQRMDSSVISEKWDSYTKTFHENLKEQLMHVGRVTFNSFSDTIIITCEIKEENTDQVLQKFGNVVALEIIRSIELGIPIRGCFSIGTFFHQGQFIIGPAIDEASQYYELPQWIGISTAPSSNFKLNTRAKNDSILNEIYLEYDLPLKNSIEPDAWVINWPQRYYELTNSENTKTKFEDILKIIDNNLKELTDIDPTLKWRNTRKFFLDKTNQSNSDIHANISK